MAKKVKTKILSLIVAVIILIVVVIILVFVFSAKEESKPGTEELTIANEIYGFSATIKEIQGKILVLEGQISSADDVEQKLVEITAKGVVTDMTKIVKLKFPENVPEDDNEPVYPKETEISFKELKIGDKIDIGAFTNISENIKNNTEFELKHIFIIGK